MKKTLILAITIFASIACNQQDNSVNPTVTPSTQTVNNKLAEITAVQLKDRNLSEYLKKAFTDAEYFDEKLMNQLSEKSLNVNSFNFDSFTRVRLAKTEGEAILISSNNFPNYSLVVFKVDDNYQTPMLIETQKDNSVKYYDLNFANSFGLKKETSGFKFVSYYSSDLSLSNSKNSRSVNCGQATMDCITEAYSQHGWVSVWAWVQTAFLPQTAAAIAIACGAGNCGGINYIRPSGEHR